MNVVSFGGGTNSTAMIVGMYLHKKAYLSKQDAQYLEMAERMATVEASAKQAHHRLDRLEKITDNPPD